MISGRANDDGGVMAEAEPSAAGQVLKKGPWTGSEDAILIEYVKKHGEGNWNSVQKSSGLMRCGKSCRLRWANHLRPNLKKGSFTPKEERIIIELHAKLGNKWARMASQLPGRTDNEIKNYWNTRMKRRQRAGLPTYPKEFQKEAAPFHFQQREQQKYPNSSSPSFSRLLCSSQKAHCYQSVSLCDRTHLSASLDNPQNHVNSSLYSNPNHQFKNVGNSSTNNGSLVFPLSFISPYAHSSSSAPLFHQNLTVQAIPPTSPRPHYNSVDFGTNISFNSLIMEAQVEQIVLVAGPEPEPPSNQTPSHVSNPFSSSSVGSASVMKASSRKSDSDEKNTTPVTQGDINSGLLDALLQEAKTLSCKRQSCSSVASNKGKHAVADESTEEEEEEEMYPAEAAKHVRLTLRDSSEASGENQCDDLSSFQSSNGMKSTDQEPMEEINSMDDDLSILLNNFPSTMPLPDWYRQSRGKSNGSSSAIAEDGKGFNPQRQGQDTSMTQAAATIASPSLEWTFCPHNWNNMPGIC